MRWSDGMSATGMPGMLQCCAPGYVAGQGYHASMSRFDMHNTLIANGPDFRTGFVDRMPTGNVDLAPTILRILNVKQPVPMDGRVLQEAMTGASGSLDVRVHTQTLEASDTEGATLWHQYLVRSQVGSTVYYDEGNAGTAP